MDGKCSVCKNNQGRSTCNNCGNNVCDNSTCWSYEPKNIFFCHPAWTSINWSQGFSGKWICQNCYEKLVAPLVKRMPEIIAQVEKVIIYSKNYKGKIPSLAEPTMILKTPFFREKDDAILCLKNTSTALGFNIILDLTFEKDTGLDGNYKFTIFSATGRAGFTK